jgi:PAS domain S-box-containing protein
MNLQGQKPPAPLAMILLFCVIFLSVLAGGIFYYYYQQKRLLSEKQIELSAISDLKIRQITQWQSERRGDGRFLSENRFLARNFSKFLKSTSDKRLHDDIYQSLKSLAENFDYSSARLLDSDGRVRLAYPSTDTLVGSYLKQYLKDINACQKVVLTDLHRVDKERAVHLDLIVPVFDFCARDTLVSGLLIVTVDPHKILFPLIQSWPTSSKSAETLIIKKDGIEVVFLNELRHLQNTELILKKPLSSSELPAAMAVHGILGTVNGLDYRGVSVVASMKKIPGMPWYMVAKIDREEVFLVLNKQMKLVIIILTLFVLSIGLFLGVIWWNQRVRYYRHNYETERNRLALVKHFDYILKFANDIILLFDNKFNIIEANDRALETYQYSRDEIIGMRLEKIRAPETLSDLPAQMQVVDVNKSSTFETFHKRKDNSVFQVEVSSRLVNIEGSKYYQTIGRDITKRKSIENTLKESEEKFRKIFEESPYSIVLTGKDFSILRANLSFSKMIGYSEEELKLLTFKDFSHPDYVDDNEISLLKLVAGKIPVYHTEKRYICKNRSIVWGSTTVNVIRNDNGEAQLFLVMIEDITYRKMAEEDLIAAKEKAEESDRLKTAFLHNISHEIRTPMNAIIGFSTLLNDHELAENERFQYLDIISQSSNQLLSIINDIVDIANVESGQVKMNIREMNLNSSLISICEQFRHNEEHSIPIKLSNGLSDEKSNILTDSTKLIQVLSNLISNALKFTSQGQIDFGYINKDSFLEFFVKDTGIGIPADHLEKIFNRFYQVDGAVSRQYGGTGLGLSICKAYVEMMGGTINVKSEFEKGTIFTFTIIYKEA